MDYEQNEEYEKHEKTKLDFGYVQIINFLELTPKAPELINELIKEGILEGGLWDVRIKQDIDLQRKEDIIRKIAKDDFEKIWSFLQKMPIIRLRSGYATFTITGPHEYIKRFNRFVAPRKFDQKQRLSSNYEIKMAQFIQKYKSHLDTQEMWDFLFSIHLETMSKDKMIFKVYSTPTDIEAIHRYGSMLERIGQEFKDLVFNYDYVNIKGREQHIRVVKGVLFKGYN